MARVLHYLDTETFAGTEQYLLTLLPALKAQGIECGLVLCEANEKFVQRAKGLTEIPVFVEPALPMRKAIPNFMRRVRDWNADLVHGHNGRTMLACAWVHARTRGRIHSIGTQHFVEPAHSSYKGGKKLAADRLHRWTNRHLTRIIAISEAVRESAIEREHLPSDQIVTVHNGIEKPVAFPDRAREVVRSLGISDDAPLIVTTARLSEEKGHRFLLEAVPDILEAVPDAHFLWLGTGDQADEIKQQVIAKKLENHIHLLGFRTDAPDFVALADLLVLPSLCEPFGLALVEAMMLNTPVVATDCGGPPEILAPAYPKVSLETATGALVPSGDGAALGEIVRDLLQNRTGREQIGQNGGNRARQCFTAERMAIQIARVYAECLG